MSSRAMHALANPARFVRIARPVTAWLLLIGATLAIAGMAAGLALTPPDYLQGETVRIMYIHVPSALLGMAGGGGIAAASVSGLVWGHPFGAGGGPPRGAGGAALSCGFPCFPAALGGPRPGGRGGEGG